MTEQSLTRETVGMLSALRSLTMSTGIKRLNPDTLIGDLEKALDRYKVTMDVRRFTGDVVLYDKDGMEVCSFNKLSGKDGPANLEIGHDYVGSYSTGR